MAELTCAELTRTDPTGGRAISHNAAFRKLPLPEGVWFHRVALYSSSGGSRADGRLRARRGRQLWAPSPRVSTDHRRRRRRRSPALPAATAGLSAPGTAGDSGRRRPGPVYPSLPRGRRAVSRASRRASGRAGERAPGRVAGRLACELWGAPGDTACFVSAAGAVTYG